VIVSGIFQAAEDLAVLGWWNGRLPPTDPVILRSRLCLQMPSGGAAEVDDLCVRLESAALGHTCFGSELECVPGRANMLLADQNSFSFFSTL
jgi:hypothetical protein